MEKSDLLQLAAIHYSFITRLQEYSGRVYSGTCPALVRTHNCAAWTVLGKPRSNRELAAFELFLHVGEKLFGVGAVDDAMIEAEREIRHLPNRDVVFAVR